ncbi:MAG TPA: PAS domain S-box protein [Pyrinomonadaceae bacterium]|nr:PAS domain S-box protein [Pyrinomonadaceae bacterium]
MKDITVTNPPDDNDVAILGGRGSSNSKLSNAQHDLCQFAHDYADEVAAELIAQLREQETLRRSEARYRDFFENAKDAIYVHDLSGRYLMVNRAGEKLVGYSRDELLRMTVFDLVPASHFALVGDSLKQKLKDHAQTIYEVELIKKDRSRLPIEVSSHLIYENGIPVGVQGTARDISERRCALEAVKESEARFRTVAVTAADAIITIDEDSIIHLVNPAAERIFGYTSEEMLGKSLSQLMPERFRGAHHKAVATYLKTHSKQRSWEAIELPGLDKGGREVPLELSFAEYTRAGKCFFTGIARDISGRKRAEKALRESEERFRTLFENAREAIFTCDLSGNFTSINQAGEALTGFSREETLESNFARVVAPECLPIAREMLSRKGSGDVATTYELELVTKQGRRILVEVSSRTLHEDGEPIGVQGSVRDITTQKRDEDALRKSEEQYRVLFDRNPQPMWVYELQTLAFLAVNDAAVRHYGYSRERFLAMTVDAIHPHEDVPALVEELSRIDGHCHLGEWRHCVADGKTISVEITADVIDFANRKAGLVLVNDITGHKIAEEALRISQAQLQQSQKLEAVGQLAGGVAHDFNNLLTAIGGYTDLTLRRLTDDDPLRSNLLEIKKVTNRAASLTRQLLAFSRKQILEPKVLDLNAVITDMFKMLRRLIGEDVELVADLSTDLGKVKADPGQVEQILMNLVVNARDAMPHGGTVTIETKNVTLDEGYAFHHVPMQPGDYTMLAISDTGLGMDKGTQSHVFEPFFTTKPAGKGTGLGLSTVYGIVKQSGGYVWVYSEVGNGTVFKIYLPRVTSKHHIEKPKSLVVNTSYGKERILLVEDEEIVRRMARMILENHGYSVLEALDVKDALRICLEKGKTIDLLLTDVIMPGMSGRVLSERIADLLPDLPVLYMSGYTDDAIVRNGILDEGICFLQKPFTRESLLAKVREALKVDVQA